MPRYFTAPWVIGIYKYSVPFLAGVLWDFLCLLAILYHRHRLKLSGLWIDEVEYREVSNRRHRG